MKPDDSKNRFKLFKFKPEFKNSKVIKRNPFLKTLLDLLVSHKEFLTLVSLMALISLALYTAYIFGGRLFLFEDFGSDSVRVSLPTYIYYFDWLRSGMPLWSDKMGIGTSVLSHSEIIFDPFTYLFFIFGREGIISMFTYVVLVKIFLSGIFFWFFLTKFKISGYSRIVASLVYAFGGYMIVTGQNYVFSTIYVYFPLLLLGFEIWLEDKRRLLLCLMLFLIAVYFFYFFYMVCIFFAAYVLIRYYMTYRFQPIHFFRYIAELILISLVAVGLSAFFWLPSLALTLNNLRIGSANPTLYELFIPNKDVIGTATSRLFGHDVLGKAIEYKGFTKDYYQLVLYSSIPALLFSPQAFLVKEKKEKIGYILFFTLLPIFILFPFFGYLFNAFSDFNFRWTFFYHLIFSLLLAISLDKIFQKREINFVIFALSGIAVLIISLIAINLNYGRISISEVINTYRFSYLFILAYYITVIVFFLTRLKNKVKIIFVLLVCIELVLFSKDFINERTTSPVKMLENKYGFFDNTSAAIKYLHDRDKSIYRIDKSYDSVISEYGKTPSLNDSLVQGYRGLKSYSANNQPNYIRFLLSLGIFVKYPPRVLPPGTSPYDPKYIDYHYINGVENRFILQSFLGVKYHLAKSNTKLPQNYLFIKNIEDVHIFENQNSLPLGFTVDEILPESKFSELLSDDKDLALLSYAVLEDGVFEKIKLKKVENLTYKSVPELITDRRKNEFKITSYREDKISGNIVTRNNSILVITIPFDPGWQAKIDGKKSNLLKVDIGLMGVFLSPGNHQIDLTYFPPYMNMGILLSLLTLFTIIVWNRTKVTRYISKMVKKLKLFGIYFLVKTKKMEKTKLMFYSSMSFGLFTFLFLGLITRGKNFQNLFNPDRGAYYMDFYRVLQNLFDGPYTHDSIYPPLPLLIYKGLLRLVPYDIASMKAELIRATQAGQIVLLLYFIATFFVFVILMLEMKRGKRLEKYFFTSLMLFSAPFLHQFERANIIFVSLISLLAFFLFKDSRNKWLREISLFFLSASAAIKIYPAIFILLLLKEKRFKDFFKVIFYTFLLFFVPLILIGGLSQIGRFFDNVFMVSQVFRDWGLGYTVNFQNSLRILFAIFGNFDYAIIKLSQTFAYLLLIIGIISIYFMKTKWKIIALLTSLMILVPFISFEYVLIFMVIPLVFFLDETKAKNRRDYFYLTCFIFIFVPLGLGNIDFADRGFKNLILPLSLGVLIQNIALMSITFGLIIESLKRNETRKRLKVVLILVIHLARIIYSPKSKSLYSYSIVAIKLLLTALVLIVIGIYSFYYYAANRQESFNITESIQEKVDKGYPYIYKIEPYYVHFGDKIIINGMNFSFNEGKHVNVMSEYGELDDEIVFWSNTELVVTVPLHWRIGKVKIWLERPSTEKDRTIHKSNLEEVDLLDRLGRFNYEDRKYFSQIKYLDSRTKYFNNFKNHKSTTSRITRRFPTIIYQLYSDFVELKSKILYMFP